MHAVRARIFALLAALLMLLPSGAAARAEYQCRVTGRILAASACASGVVSPAAAPTQRLQRADCCQRLLSSSRGTAPGTRQAPRGVPAANLLTASAPPFTPGNLAAAGSVCAESTQAPLAIGPPLFIVHCALLS
jgi:hypothetical protein